MKDKTCKIEGCGNVSHAKGFCSMHYSRVYNGCVDMHPGKITDSFKKRKKQGCIIDGCNNKYYAKGFCKNHYTINWRRGTPFYKTYEKGIYKVKKCEEQAYLKGYCILHYGRKKQGVRINRPWGVKGKLNPRWNNGTSDYPNHYQMKKNRLVILKEANYICEYCGGKANEVHHKDLSKNNHSLDNLAASCHKCNCNKLRRNKNVRYLKIYGKPIRKIKLILGVSRNKVKIMHFNNTLSEKLKKA